ncbi:MAG: hypothetical protein GY811_27120 [Myxococcales bacterium]|nr:hypothetical protein [Myxococcales bacterium]
MAASRLLLASVLLAGVSSCSSSKNSSEDTPRSPKKDSHQKPATAKPVADTGKALPDGTRTIERTKLSSIAHKDLDGESRQWTAQGGIVVDDTDYRELYRSRGEHFIGFRGTVKAASEDCLVHWKAELIKSATGRGQSIGKIEGTLPVPAETSAVASGLLALSPAAAASIGSASVGYWSLCGDALPSPSVFDVLITETNAEQIKFGKSFDLHHTRLNMESKVAATKKPRRCYFEMVAEDIDADGFTLNRDFASFSLTPGAKGGANIRRTTFEGGNESDYAKQVAGKRSYLRKLNCKAGRDSLKPKLEGIRIGKLKAHRYEGEPTTAEHHVRATYGHSATFENTTGKDCSFRIRYRMLDTSGMPLNRSPVLSESVHLRKDAKVDYRSAKNRLFVWLEQAGQVGSLVAEQAAPIQACGSFDESRAL